MLTIGLVGKAPADAVRVVVTVGLVGKAPADAVRVVLTVGIVSKASADAVRVVLTVGRAGVAIPNTMGFGLWVKRTTAVSASVVTPKTSMDGPAVRRESFEPVLVVSSKLRSYKTTGIFDKLLDVVEL
jgi:hypothetical protein